MSAELRAWVGLIAAGIVGAPPLPNAALPPPRIELVDPRDEIDELVNWQLETGRGR